MKLKMIVLGSVLLLATACGYSGKDIKGGEGYFVCKSNQGRPDLSFHSDTFSMTLDPISNIGSLSFIDIPSGQRYTIHTVEDRDYHCERSTGITVPKKAPKKSTQ